MRKREIEEKETRFETLSESVGHSRGNTNELGERSKLDGAVLATNSDRVQ